MPAINSGIIKKTRELEADHERLKGELTGQIGISEIYGLMQKNRQYKNKYQENGNLLILSLAAALMLVLSFIPENAGLAQEYQAAEPKLDSVPNKTPETEKSKSTLKGSIQKVDKKNNKNGHFASGAKRGQQDSLKARVNNESALKAQAESSIGIIGVKFVAIFGKPPVINEIFPNTPAEKVGLKVYDLIIAVDGVPTSGLTKEEVFDLIVGTPGTQVSLSILRNSEYSAVTCTRMDINELLDPRIRRDYMIHM